MKIGIDLDNVEFDIEQPLIEIYEWLTRERLSKKNWTKYNLRDNFSAEIEKAVFKIFSDRRMLRDLPLLSYARESLEILVKENELFVVTNRGPYFSNTKEDTIEALEATKILYSDVIFTPDKKEAIRKLDLSCYIEDNLENALAISYICKCYLFDYPYNRQGRQKQGENGNLIIVPGFEDESWWPNVMKEFSLSIPK